jgi:hypothetical protein
MLKTLLTPLFALFLISGFYGCTKDNDPVDVDNIKVDVDNIKPKAIAGLHHELTLPIDTFI